MSLILPFECLPLALVLNFPMASANIHPQLIIQKIEWWRKEITKCKLPLTIWRNKNTYPCFISYDKHQSCFPRTKQPHHNLIACSRKSKECWDFRSAITHTDKKMQTIYLEHSLQKGFVCCLLPTNIMTPPALYIGEPVCHKIKIEKEVLLFIEESRVQKTTHMLMRTMSETASAKRALCFSKAVSS